MSKPIDFYFDFSSPYGYFASTAIDALGAKYGRAVNWHPLLLGVVFKATGGAPLPTLPLKGDYAMHDIARSARYHGIPYQKPDEFPLATQLAARSMLWVKKQHGAVRAVELGHAIFKAYFVDNRDISRPETMLHIASGIGLDATDVIDGANHPMIKEQLRTDIEAAMARGVFGSPYVIVDDEPFWGFDRFDQLEAFLKDGRI